MKAGFTPITAAAKKAAQALHPTVGPDELLRLAGIIDVATGLPELLDLVDAVYNGTEGGVEEDQYDELVETVHRMRDGEKDEVSVCMRCNAVHAGHLAGSYCPTRRLGKDNQICECGGSLRRLT